MKVINPGDSPELQVMGDPVRILLANEQVCIIEVITSAGSGIPPHVHTREDEVFHILEGQFEFQLEGKTVTAGPGTTVHLPPHQSHGFKSLGDGRVLVYIYPGQLEAMFHELAQAEPPQAPEICGRYGITFV